MAEGPPIKALAASVRDLRARLRISRRAIAQAGVDLARVDARAARLAALHEGEPGLGARLDRLARVLDPDRIGAHMRAAAAAATVVGAPVPHAAIARIWPDDVYEAAVEAIPPPVFFDDAGAGRLELPMPPSLAPISSVVVWRLLTALAAGALGPALVARFDSVIAAHLRSLGVPGDASPADFPCTASRGRLVLRLPGYAPRARRGGPWHFLTTTIALGDAAPGRDYGSQVRGEDGAAPATVPFEPNSALVVFDPAGAHEYVAIPSDAPAGTVRAAYEFPIGPTGDSRRRLVR